MYLYRCRETFTAYYDDDEEDIIKEFIKEEVYDENLVYSLSNMYLDKFDLIHPHGDGDEFTFKDESLKSEL